MLQVRCTRINTIINYLKTYKGDLCRDIRGSGFFLHLCRSPMYTTKNALLSLNGKDVFQIIRFSCVVWKYHYRKNMFHNHRTDELNITFSVPRQWSEELQDQLVRRRSRGSSSRRSLIQLEAGDLKVDIIRSSSSALHNICLHLYRISPRRRTRRWDRRRWRRRRLGVQLPQGGVEARGGGEWMCC